MENNKILAYLLEVSAEGLPLAGYLGEIENSLEALQGYVGGRIDVVALTDEIDIICNDDGKIEELPANRKWMSPDGHIIDILVGNIMAELHSDEGEFIFIQEGDVELLDKLLLVIFDD